MDLNTLCALLQRNDPSVTAVGEEEQYDDMGFHRIGEALVQGSNTHVSYIALGLSRLLPAEPLPNLEAISATGDHDGVATETVEDRLFCHGAKCAGPLLRFVRESAVLSKVSLWSEYGSGRLSVNSRLLGLFFKALLDNQQADLLEELVIGQYVFTEQSSELLGALLKTLSIRTLTITLPNDVNHYAGIGEALQSNTSLEYLELDNAVVWDPIAPRLVEEILSSLTAHPRLRTLVLDRGSCSNMGSARALSGLLSTTRTLSCLEVRDLFSTEGLQVLLDGLRICRHGALQALLFGTHFAWASDTYLTFIEFLQSASTAEWDGFKELRYYDSGLVEVCECMVIQGSVGAAIRTGVGKSSAFTCREKSW